MPRVIHFEIPADNPERACKFYADVFGWKVHKWEGPQPYWLVKTGEGPGIDGGILQRQDPSQGTMNTIDVAVLDDSIKAVEAAGGKIVLPRMAVPGIGYLAYASDPDGNIFGMMQMDPSAK
jgi:predicted enzyme related to lactoylglutathione lyase